MKDECNRRIAHWSDGANAPGPETVWGLQPNDLRCLDICKKALANWKRQMNSDWCANGTCVNVKYPKIWEMGSASISWDSSAAVIFNLKCLYTLLCVILAFLYLQCKLLLFGTMSRLLHCTINIWRNYSAKTNLAFTLINEWTESTGWFQIEFQLHQSEFWWCISNMY